MRTVREALVSAASDIWTDDDALATLLDQPATAANLSDMARLPLYALAMSQGNPNVARLLGEVTAMADAANLAPTPEMEQS